MPRFPMKLPRDGSASISPRGVPRICIGMVLLDPEGGAQKLRSLHQALLVDAVAEIGTAQCLHGKAVLR